MSSAARLGSAPIPFLRTSNVLWDEIDLTHLDTMSLSQDELRNKTLRVGDLLVCEGGDIGRSAVWQGATSPVSFQNHLHRLRAVSDRVVPRFYVFFLQSAFTQLGLFEGAANKTTIANLSRNRLAALEVPVPNVDEQRTIVDALGLLRQSMANNDRTQGSVQSLKAATMQHLFTRGVRREGRKESEIGALPESWSLARLGDLSHQIQYGLSQRGEAIGDVPILRMNCQVDGRVVSKDLQFVDLDQQTFEKFQVRRGDILFNRTNSIELVGRTAIVDQEITAVFASYLLRI
jgi:type I restriction enzyme S subunit